VPRTWTVVSNTSFDSSLVCQCLCRILKPIRRSNLISTKRIQYRLELVPRQRFWTEDVVRRIFALFARRDRKFRRAGYRVLRLPAELVLGDLPGAVARVQQALAEKP